MGMASGNSSMSDSTSGEDTGTTDASRSDASPSDSSPSDSSSADSSPGDSSMIGDSGQPPACDGGTSCSSPSACPTQPTACIVDTCASGCCGTVYASIGMPCTDHGGVVCNGSGSCVSTHCADGVQDADETDTDCGGATCAPCSDGKKCLQGSDCVDRVCNGSHLCAAPSCADGVRNGNETDVDCGGSVCPTCANGKQCQIGTDCTSGDCTTNVCTALCGNAVRESGEQCDDGNITNLDGCSATCQFEQDQRMNGLTMQFGIDSFCSPNAFGGAVTSFAQSTFQTAMTSSVSSGATSIELEFLGLTDLTGTSQVSFQLGALHGVPAAPAPNPPYDGASDLDWWYATDPTGIDGTRLPNQRLPASISSHALSATGTLDVFIALGGSTASDLHLSGARLRATVGAADSAPTTSSGGTTPGHLAGEHLDPALTSFATMSNGGMCGNISAASLALVPVPSFLLPGGTGACIEGYSASSSMLDVLVGGCTRTIAVTVALINPTQPDQVDPGVPPAGAGGPYTLLADALHQVNACDDHDGAMVPLATCLAAAAYSSYFIFATDRVIAK